MVSPVPDSEIGAQRGRDASKARALRHAQAILPIVIAECAKHPNPPALSLEWLTDRLTQLQVRSPLGTPLTSTTVRRLLRRVNRTFGGIKADVVGEAMQAIKQAMAADVEGKLVEARQHNRKRHLDRLGDHWNLSEEDVIFEGETEDAIDLMSRPKRTRVRKRK